MTHAPGLGNHNGCTATPHVPCLGHPPPPRAGNGLRVLSLWLASGALFKTDIFLVAFSGKRVCSAIPQMTLRVLVGIPVPKEASFLPCLRDLRRGS